MFSIKKKEIKPQGCREQGDGLPLAYVRKWLSLCAQRKITGSNLWHLFPHSEKMYVILSCFVDRNMLTPVEQGEMYCPMWSGDIWRSAFIHQDCYRTLINLPTGHRPWPRQKVWIKTLLLLLSPRWWVGGGCNWALVTTDTHSYRHTFPPIPPQCFGQDKNKKDGCITNETNGQKGRIWAQTNFSINEWQNKWILWNKTTSGLSYFHSFFFPMYFCSLRYHQFHWQKSKICWWLLRGLGSFWQSQEFCANRLPCEVIIQRLALLLSWWGILL